MDYLDAPPPPPPPNLRVEDDRDEEACQALHPYLEELLRRFVAAGWHPAEIQTAAFGWSVVAMTDAAAEVGTPEAWAAVEATPEQARELIELERARLAGWLPGLPDLDDE